MSKAWYQGLPINPPLLLDKVLATVLFLLSHGQTSNNTDPSENFMFSKGMVQKVKVITFEVVINEVLLLQGTTSWHDTFPM